MLAKQYKLSLRVPPRGRARSFRNHFFSLRVSPTTLPYSRFAVVVGKSFHASAVQRNRMRRTLFSAVQAEKLYTLSGNDVILIPQRALLSLSRTKLQQELIFALAHAGVARSH